MLHANVSAALRAMLPPEAASSVWEGGHVPPLVGEDEMGAVGRAVESRRIEFARGRACARKALIELGVAAGSIPMGEHREPLWPSGIVGAITHCEGLVAAAVARVDRISALGIDAEPARSLPDDARPTVLHAGELRPDVPELETVVFSAKESVHKAVFPLEKRWLDFLDVRVELGPGRGCFAVRPASPAGSYLPVGLQGRFRIQRGYVLTAVYLAAAP